MVLIFVETKIKPSETNAMENLLHDHNFHASINPGEITPSGEGIHGGEMIAVNNNLNFKEIDKKVIQRIQAETGAAIHFAVGILRFHVFSFLLLGSYLRFSLGMNPVSHIHFRAY